MFLPGLLHRVKAIDGLRFEAHFEDPNVAGFAALTADYDIVLAHSVDGPDVFARLGLVVEPLLDEPLDVAMPADHALAAKDTLGAQDVIGYPWMGVPRASPSTPSSGRSRCRPIRRRSAPSSTPTCASWKRWSVPATGSACCPATPR